MDDVRSTPLPVTPAPTPQTATPARHNASSPGVKDTLESILIAFILAFVFRAFVVEAFVIPTGSMGPTLLGAHMRFHCPDCGYAFDLNYSSRESGDDLNIPSVAGPEMVEQEQRINGQLVKVRSLRDVNYTVYCPNCGYKIDQAKMTDSEESATNPPVYYGDRILVLKYLYLFQHPHRWDVVVFKNPSDNTRLYQTNYIKRLIGNPGESVVIFDGDVYIAHGAGDKLSDFTIQTKPRYAQESLWRIVYDNDYYPLGRERQDGDRWVQPWQSSADGSGWNLGAASSTQRIFTFENASGAGTIAFNPPADAKNQPLTDWLAYDAHYMAQMRRQPINVSDLKLDFFYQRKTGDGPLQLQLSKRDQIFTAEIYPDHVSLLRRHGSGSDELLAQTPISGSSRPRHVEFANIDYQVTLRVDDQDLLRTTPAQYHPDLEALLTEFNNDQRPPRANVSITGQRQSSIISHINLWRDVYYINSGSEIISATPRSFPSSVTHLSQDQYFVMGDNSVMSYDARYWPKDVELPDENLYCPAGRVPKRFMLGKAFFVYWPAGFRPVSSAPSLIPDFGDMRFIH